MNLRNVTIWLTGVMLIVSIVVPAGLEHWCDGVVPWLVLLLTNSLPLLLSLLIARKLKHMMAVGTLFCATILYGLWYGFGLLCVCFISLSALLPAWVVALRLDSYFEKNL